MTILTSDITPFLSELTSIYALLLPPDNHNLSPILKFSPLFPIVIDFTLPPLISVTLIYADWLLFCFINIISPTLKLLPEGFKFTLLIMPLFTRFNCYFSFWSYATIFFNYNLITYSIGTSGFMSPICNPSIVLLTINLCLL